MAESGLSLGYSDFQRLLAVYLGFSSDSSTWTAVESQRLDDIIAAGLRQFYEPAGYEWTFMRPVTTLATVADQDDYNLPDDFGGIEGRLSYSSSDSRYVPILLTGEGRIRERRQSGSLGDVLSTGTPREAAVQAQKHTDPNEGQRFTLMLWPTPDAVYTLSYRYNVLPPAIDDDNPYPYGGQRHAETIKYAILSVAELEENDAEGPYTKRFMRLLATSIEADKKAMTPEWYGYNGDYSEGGGVPRQRSNIVTVDGVSP